ncbi:ABC transporter ATP-binding protein [Dyadobacter luteus]|jgi:ABC-2 type transport system ATP-binding protein|uniref:ABC transporter ATP-binding protein n=1 Tax=Dyadobacter luteus TaxID=2259619 RepID=A0A3D8Y9X8_9BACT|nr:ATP-binding cassette domain-containing protein [Dyadobacter luteus]REA59877.1 ABC transporter ATP-binding protein [Dyadobacter luteus]
MSIQVTNLSKIYGAQRAIDNISFDLKPGEIVGFLGPNGAGKSTTMKILTGYLQPTSGNASVSGFDVLTQPMPARRAIGYLPEHNPLYLDMYVKEFLQFSGKLYGISGATLKTRISEVISMCGLEVEQHKKIGQLSKGYRQRVGLAQSFLHDPEVLILDEPTTGLDPNQILEIRELIRTAGSNKTVLFSTHIMQEVEALCDRVIIINKGKVVSDSSLDTLRQSGESLEAIFRKLTGNQ